MLKELIIHNFATIEYLTVEFESGLNVLTGETGAGKSIIVDALNLALGGRADTEVIRTGEQNATIEALFYVRDSKILQLMHKLGIELEADQLIIKRIISANNKNRTYINGNNVTVNALSQIGNQLVDIHGQHDHQTLLNSELHIELLDAYGKLLDDRIKFKDEFTHYRTIISELGKLQKGESERLQREDLLKFQIEEIDSANLTENEEGVLETDKLCLVNAEKINQALGHALSLLTDQDGSIEEQIGLVNQELEKLEECDPYLKLKTQQTQTLIYEIEDLISDLQSYAQNSTSDPSKLEEIEDRIAEINNLKRKYGKTISSILEFRQTVGEELEKLSGNQKRISDIKEQLRLKEKLIADKAVIMAKKREKIAADFGKKMKKELNELNMNKAKLSVKFDYEPGGFIPFKGKEVKVTSKGIGNAEFLFSPNPGEELRPLVKIASGGELARVMLALKTILNKQDTIPILVFDEVDTGVGGSVAEKIGFKLKTIASKKQVFCITHLPQIAGMAGTHYLIAKQTVTNRTCTCIRRLNGDERVEEIARMSGGAKITEITRQHAREMINSAVVEKKT